MNKEMTHLLAEVQLSQETLVKLDQRLGFTIVPDEEVHQALVVAQRLMQEAGMRVHPLYDQIPLVVTRATGGEAAADLAGSRGSYYRGMIRLAEGAGFDTLVHECVHHLQGAAILSALDPWFGLQRDRTPYRYRWYEQEAFMIQKAFLTGWAADSWPVRFWNWNQKRIWDR